MAGTVIGDKRYQAAAFGSHQCVSSGLGWAPRRRGAFGRVPNVRALHVFFSTLLSPVTLRGLTLYRLRWFSIRCVSPLRPVPTSLALVWRSQLSDVSLLSLSYPESLGWARQTR